MPNDGKSIVQQLAYYVGNPANAAVAAFDVPKGTIVSDPTNGTLYRKTAALGTNTAGYDTLVTDTATQTLTNKTLTSPTITGAVISNTVTTISGDGAVALQSGITLLTKGSAAAITVAAPGAAGIRITITTGSDFAHVVTFTGGTLWDGTATANTTWTSAAVQGSSITFVSISSTKWNVESFNLGTIAP